MTRNALNAVMRADDAGMEPYVTVFGIRYFVPVLRTRFTVLAVNVGGAVVPAPLSAYLIVHDHLGWLALAAVAITGALVHLVVRPVPRALDRGTRTPRMMRLPNAGSGMPPRAPGPHPRLDPGPPAADPAPARDPP